MKTATLIDGRVVSTYSEEFRHECEARAILQMENKNARRCFLYGWTEYEGTFPIKHRGILQIRGPDEVKRLEQTIMALWRARQPKPA